MLKDKCKDYNIILASGSPRRQELFKTLDVVFKVITKPVEEIYPEHLKRENITDFLAQLKAEPFMSELNSNDILITSDTIVWHNNMALGKPKDEQDAFQMLKSMRSTTHSVYSSVCITTTSQQKIIHDHTLVTFNHLSDDEIWYYINNFKPFDKAGAYGIQDWLGQVKVSKIEGSYYNVMGFPVHLVYKALKDLEL